MFSALAVLSTTVAVAAAVQVVEYYNANLDHYFILPIQTRPAAIDSARGAGLEPHRNSFKSGGSTSVCRFLRQPIARAELAFLYGRSRRVRQPQAATGQHASHAETLEFREPGFCRNSPVTVSVLAVLSRFTALQ